MKKVLLFSRDPGGTNTLIPLYEKLKEKYEVLVYGKDVAVKWFLNEGISCNDITEIYKEFDLKEAYIFLRNISPEFVITGTSLDDYAERYLWKAAEQLGIKTFAVLDQWMNMGIRFSEYNYKQCELYEKEKKHLYLPWRICVMDELARNILCREGIASERICVTGQPHFEQIKVKYDLSHAAFDALKWNVLFASEPIMQDYEDGLDTCSYWGFNEKGIYQALYAALCKLADCYNQEIRLIVKPHPRETGEAWKTIAERDTNNKVEVLLSGEENKYALFQSADMVCGMSSMMLLEAAICGKDILSITVGLKRENPFILDKIGVCKSCLNEKELFERIEESYKAKVGKKPFKYIENASEQVLSCIEKEM